MIQNILVGIIVIFCAVYAYRQLKPRKGSHPACNGCGSCGGTPKRKQH